MTIHKFSKKGSSYSEIKKENQDYLYSIDGKEFLAIMLADGATACEKGLEGAKLSCRAVAQVIEQEGDVFFSYPKEKIAYLLTEQILYCIECHMKEESDIWEYGSTFSLVFMEKKTGRTVLVNLGDGAIFKVTEQGISYLLKPKKFRGNPCLTTTEGAEKVIDIEVFHLALGESIVVCSDGFLKQLGKENVFSMLTSYDIEKLNEQLNLLNNADDCSYISFTRERK